MKYLRVFGIILFVLGGLLLINSFTGITGLVILGEVNEVAGSLSGIALVVLGTMLMVLGKIKEENS